jgi:hypothetical protein
MDPIKEAFAKAKQDIAELKSTVTDLSLEIKGLKNLINEILASKTPAIQQTNQQIIPTNPHISSTDRLNELDEMPLYGLKSPNNSFSTGNRGVPTNRQTHQQTDQQVNSLVNTNFWQGKSAPANKTISHLEQVSNVLNSLDSIKKDLRSQFKRLTPQEMSVFSLIYQLESDGFIVDYPLLSSKLNLSESSIRDYTQKIIKKGIPLVKLKENNKKIILSVPQELRKIATIETIYQLREI